ncbi:keratin, type I cytoskeletal 23 isoform X1 [Neopelma chrysocephalum]|uniref:keratin, type I cytoskeletal 23 isoform X1 n=2 Tax=Neopelma chrysocephalum TaxID=114329 RepID=UPI000FCD0462|nr:keratin, type I cytoskeletal 23 isoform X1 [Neopelma chrysocephalum]
MTQSCCCSHSSKGNSHRKRHKAAQGRRRGCSVLGSQSRGSIHTELSMSTSQGPFQFFSGSLRGSSGCGLAQQGTSYRASSADGGASSTHPSFSSARPLWLPAGGAPWAGCGEHHGESIFLGGNEKQTMQNLNERLAAYLDKVRALEAANAQLESCILEWHRTKSHGKRHDFNQYEQNVTDMQRQIEDGKITNASILLQIDNASMASEDFRLKYEAEKCRRQGVQLDVENLRKELDGLTIINTDLEMEIEGLREEHILRRKDHEEDMQANRSSQDFQVNVKVNAAPPEDLGKILAEIREDYEAIIEKNRQSLDNWYKEQSSVMSLAATPNPEEIQRNENEIKELTRTLQALDIELQAQISKKHMLEDTLADTRNYYAAALQNMQQIISRCEEELSQVRHDMKQQNNQYKVLLGIKTRLEKEISTYRLLLEGNADGTARKSEAKEHAGLSKRKLKAIVHDSVNGEVVSSTINEIPPQA